MLPSELLLCGCKVVVRFILQILLGSFMSQRTYIFKAGRNKKPWPACVQRPWTEIPTTRWPTSIKAFERRSSGYITQDVPTRQQHPVTSQRRGCANAVGGGSPQLYHDYHDCSGRIPGHTTRAPPVGFEPETNGFQFYAIANLDKTIFYDT